MYQVMDARFVGLIFSCFNTDPNLVSLLDIVCVNPFSPRDVEDIIIWLHSSLHSRHLELRALKGDVFPSCLLHFFVAPITSKFLLCRLAAWCDLVWQIFFNMRREVSFLKLPCNVCLLYKHLQNSKPLHYFAVKGEISYVTIAALTFLCVKITCYCHVWKYHIFAR